jgi:curved DNA-binding protein CbpA
MSKEAIERVAQASDVYETLNVSPDATPAQIKKAYYNVSREVHPDKNDNSPEALEAFQKVNEAYDFLKDPSKKKTSGQGLGAAEELLPITSGREPDLVEDEGEPEEAAEEEAAEEEGQQVGEEAGKEAKTGKDKKKDPMLELLDELSAFVAQVNKKITNAIKEVGQEAWEKLKNTGPMQTLGKALDEAKGFINDKIDEGLDSVKNSAAVTAAKSKIDAIKNKIESSFSEVMNAAANEIAKRVHEAVAPKEDKEQNQEHIEQNQDRIEEEDSLELVDLEAEEPEFSQSSDTPMTLEQTVKALGDHLAENDEANSKAITPFKESAEEEHVSEITTKKL